MACKPDKNEMKVWMPDEASTVCMRCGAEFGRLVGASRHHCRACGDLICQTCKVASVTQSHVITCGSEYKGHVAPESNFKVMIRPQGTSLLGSAYLRLTSNTDVVKFCQPCMTHITKEHNAFREATYLLHALSMLGVERQIRLVSIAVRAYLANFEYTTGLAVLGKRVYDVLSNPFYTPKVSEILHKDSQMLNQLLAGFFCLFLERWLSASSGTSERGMLAVYAELDSLFVKNKTRQYTMHTFISCLLNSSQVSNMQSKLIRYLVSDASRCMHIILSQHLLGYHVKLFGAFLSRTWSGILTTQGTSFVMQFPSLLHLLIKANGCTHPYKAYLSQIRSPLRNSVFANMIYSATTPELVEELCRMLDVKYVSTLDTLRLLYEKIYSTISDTERLEATIQLPWLSNMPNPLVKLKTTCIAHNILRNIFSHEPKTLLVDHVISDKTQHMARISQSFYAFAEPNFAMNNVMQRLFTITQRIVPLVQNTTHIQQGMQYIFPLANSGEPPALLLRPVVVVVPGTVSESRVLHIDSTISGKTMDITVNMLVTILLLLHLQTFIDVEIHPSLNLVEVGLTSNNHEIIQSCLTFSASLALREHLLHGSLSTHMVLSITTMLTNLMSKHIDEVYMSLLSLVTIGVKQSQLAQFLDNLINHCKEGTVLEVILAYLV